MINLADAIDQFYLGLIYNLSNITYRYTTHTALDQVGYQIGAIFAANKTWTPVQPLQVADSEVGANFLASNSIFYLALVKDIWFSANQIEEINGQTVYWATTTST
jgi:hypothetical protein